MEGSVLEKERRNSRTLRRSLHGLVALEATHIAIGGVVLAIIAVRAVVIAERSVEAAALTLAALIAFTHLAISVRVRAGQSILRKELVALESKEERAAAHAPGGPYRSSRIDTEGGRTPEAHWRRLALLLLVSVFAMSLASVPIVAKLLGALP
jgi:hypothetical protein